MSNGSNVTLKHPTGPWWTIYGTAGEIVQQIQQVFPHLTGGPTDFPLIVANASSEWATLVNGAAPAAPVAHNTGFGSPAPAQAAPAAAPAAPGGAPNCAHGPMKWVQAKPDSGKDWKGWFCSGPRELSRDQKCPTEWRK